MKFNSSQPDNMLTETDVKNLTGGKFCHQYINSSFKLQGRIIGTLFRGGLFGLTPTLTMEFMQLRPNCSEEHRLFDIRLSQHTLSRTRDGILTYKNKDQIITLTPWSHTAAGLIELTRLEVEWPTV